MSGLPSSSSKLKRNKIFPLAVSTLTTLALAGSINHARANTLPSPHLQPPPPTIAQTPINTTKIQTASMTLWGLIPVVLVGGLIILLPLFFGGLVVIGEREVGIVIKKFVVSGRGLPAGRFIALNGEAGLQADTLAPGWHWGYWPWQYSVKKEPVVVIPQGEIALIVASR